MTAEPVAAKRLLFLINDARFFVTHILPLARAAIAAGYDTHIALPFHGTALDASADLAAIHATGAVLHDVPLRRGGMAVFRELQACARIWQLMRQLRPDILHAITIKPILYGGLAARLLRLKQVIFFITGLGHVFIAQGYKARAIRYLVMLGYRLVLRYGRAITVFENAADRALFLQAGLLRQAQSVLIPGVGVNCSEFYPAPQPPPFPPVVMLPARLQSEKGVREFVAASERLAAQGITVRMVLVGYADFDRPEGITAAELQAWRGQGVIEWWGHSTTMPETLRQAHIVCLPSYREGFSKTLIEAAASGLPVITSDVPGCRDAVRAGETALLIPPRDASALAEALVRLLRDADLRARMGAKGRALAIREFSVERFIAANLALYERPRT
ncbi:unnamed protein product [Phaeothamnion confervicola]